MDPKQIARQMIQFTKTTFDNTFDAITVFQEQTEKLIGTYLEQAPIIPEEGKKAITDWMKAYKKSREEFKTAVNDNYKKLEESFWGHDRQIKSGTAEEPEALKVHPVKKAAKEPKAAKTRPAKKVKKKKSRAKKVTNIDKVVGLVQGSAEGISAAELKEKTGLAENQIWNIINSAAKAGKVKRIRRGVYGAS
jgi:polyhydroxyalkanoate synthesis regulator phasin